jgi:hypothetical protein
MAESPVKAEIPVKYGVVEHYINLLDAVKREELISERQIHEIIAIGREYPPERARVGNLGYSNYRKAVVRRIERDDRSHRFMSPLCLPVPR